jgi:glycosyltransferase involved in cell wall biosynthesis
MNSKMNSDKITIIVPVYNVEKYIKRCIESLISQTYVNIEIILIDDGSKDRCAEICKNYLESDNRILFFHKNNEGLSEARNDGIRLSSGKYLTFIDSDDWVKNTYIESLYNSLVINNSDIAICCFQAVPNSAKFVEEQPIQVSQYTNLEALRQLDGKFKTEFTISCGKLYSRRLFSEIRFPLGKLHEDEFTTYKLLYASTSVSFTTERLLYYWQRSDSITGKKKTLVNYVHTLEAWLERAELFERIGEYSLYESTCSSMFDIIREIDHNTLESESYPIICEYSDIRNNAIRMYISSNTKAMHRILAIIYFHFPRIGYHLFKMKNNISELYHSISIKHDA